MPAWTYLENGGRHAELVWARRLGKDEVCMHRTAVAAFERQAAYWHMLPKYAQARKAIWAAVNPHTGKRRIDEAFPKELRSATREQEMSITFKNGSTWQVVGSDNPDSLVGAPPAGIVYSEWALSNPECRAYLRPIIHENNGWQIFNTTPRGRNHAYKTLKSAENDPDAFAQVLNAIEAGTMSQATLEKELQAYINDFGEDYGRARFEQEYLCSFDAANLGAILARSLSISERNGYISDDVTFDEYGAPIEISCDLGRRDTATWWFWQPVMGGYKIIDCLSGYGIDAEEWAVRLHDRMKRYDGKLGRVWLPHDAKAKTFSAKHSAAEIFLRDFGSAHVAMVPRSSIADRVNAARVIVPRVKFHRTNCEVGLDGLRAWAYEYDAEKKMFSSDPLHDWASHYGDGFSYGCLVMQQAEPPPVVDDKPRSIFVGANTVTLEDMWASTPKTNGRI